MKNIQTSFKYLIFGGVLLFTFFLYTSPVHAATLYFNNAIDGDWNNLGNWWTDSGFTIQALTLPTTSDDVIVSGYIDTNAGPAISINSLVLNGADQYITVDFTVANGAFFYDTSANVGIITGDATFNNNSYLALGSVSGTMTFNDSSYNEVNISGNPIYNDTSYSFGIVTGNPIYNDSSWSSGAIIGNPVFNNLSFNNANITGDPIYNNDAHSSSGTNIVGNPVYNDASYNAGTVTGSSTFYDLSSNNATVTGDATFYDTSTNWGTVTGDACFDATATNSGTVGGLVTVCPGIFTLTYSAGANGSLTGDTSQTINEGDDGTAVTAVPDSGYEFTSWSDASIVNPRTDLNVSGDITVTASFSLIVEEVEEISTISYGSSAKSIRNNLLNNNIVLTIPTDPNAPAPKDCLASYNFSPTTGARCPMLINQPMCILTQVLKLNSKGEEVKCLQNILKITSDGIFGPITKQSVINFQTSHPPLTVDGIVGPITRGVINSQQEK